jgi:hypothetical protein
VYTIIENGADYSQQFNFALKIEDETVGWESQTLAADTFKLVVVEPPENATPVAFHGEIDGTERTCEFDDLDGTAGEVCIHMYFHYQLHPRYDVYLNRGTDLNCYENMG